MVKRKNVDTVSSSSGQDAQSSGKKRPSSSAGKKKASPDDVVDLCDSDEENEQQEQAEIEEALARIHEMEENERNGTQAKKKKGRPKKGQAQTPPAPAPVATPHRGYTVVGGGNNGSGGAAPRGADAQQQQFVMQQQLFLQQLMRQQQQQQLLQQQLGNQQLGNQASQFNPYGNPYHAFPPGMQPQGNISQALPRNMMNQFAGGHGYQFQYPSGMGMMAASSGGGGNNIVNNPNNQPTPTSNKGKRRSHQSEEAKDEPESVTPLPEEMNFVEQLRRHGIDASDAILALRSCNNDPNRALSLAIEKIEARYDSQQMDLARLRSEEERAKARESETGAMSELAIEGDILASGFFEQSAMLRPGSNVRQCLESLAEIQPCEELRSFRENAVALLVTEAKAHRWYGSMGGFSSYFTALAGRLNAVVGLDQICLIGNLSTKMHQEKVVLDEILAKPTEPEEFQNSACMTLEDDGIEQITCLPVASPVGQKTSPPIVVEIE